MKIRKHRQIFIKFYKSVIAFGLIFYLTNAVSFAPDVTVSSFLSSIGDFYANATAQNHVFAVFTVILSLPFLVIVVPAVSALILARNFFSGILSLAVFDHVEVLIDMMKDAKRSVIKLLALYGKLSKKKSVTHEKYN